MQGATLLTLDASRHLRHVAPNGEANSIRLRGLGPGRRGPGSGAGVVRGAGAAADQRAVRRAVHGAGPAGVLRRRAPARLRWQVAGPDRAVVGEGVEPDDPKLRGRRADGGVRRLGRPRPQSPHVVTSPGGRSRGAATILARSPRPAIGIEVSPSGDPSIPWAGSRPIAPGSAGSRCAKRCAGVCCGRADDRLEPPYANVPGRPCRMASPAAPGDCLGGRSRPDLQHVARHGLFVGRSGEPWRATSGTDSRAG
jgi:hypothetical protein